MTLQPLPSFCTETADAIARAARFLEGTSTLHGLIQRGGEVLDVVIQDEFSHDVIARLPSVDLVVFDST